MLQPMRGCQDPSNLLCWQAQVARPRDSPVPSPSVRYLSTAAALVIGNSRAWTIADTVNDCILLQWTYISFVPTAGKRQYRPGLREPLKLLSWRSLGSFDFRTNGYLLGSQTGYTCIRRVCRLVALLQDLVLKRDIITVR